MFADKISGKPVKSISRFGYMCETLRTRDLIAGGSLHKSGKSDSPLRLNPIGDDLKGSTPVCPANGFGPLGVLSAEAARMGRHSHPSQIQPISVPTRLNGDVGMRSFVGMPCTSSVEELEAVVPEINGLTSERCCEVSSARTVVRISGFIDAPRVVQNGKE